MYVAKIGSFYFLQIKSTNRSHKLTMQACQKLRQK